MVSPLEQFNVLLVYKIVGIFGDMSVTNTLVYLSLVLFVMVFFSYNLIVDLEVIPKKPQLLFEMLYLFIYGIILDQLGKIGLRYFPILCYLFYFIFFCNFVGLSPYGFTVTAQAINTFMLGVSFVLGVVIIGLCELKIDFFKNFIPQNVPGALLPFLTVIEVISYMIRPFSLSVRLFANMMAGHTLLNILASFVIGLLKLNVFLALLTVMLLLAIVFMELGIAFLQAYVFIVLLCVYLRESLHGH